MLIFRHTLPAKQPRRVIRMSAREYKFQSQSFKLQVKDCYVEVWLDDEVRYVGAATNCTNESPYGISNKLTDGRLGWTPFNAYQTLVQGIDGACQQLVRSAAERSLDFDKICERMRKEFEGIPS